jgi:LDH2 family malate/lactate/ureidoglycolate dehydrogenase
MTQEAAMDDPPDRVDREALERWNAAMLAAAGVRDDDAELIAGYLVEADMRGFHSHGSDQLPAYARGYREGHLDAAARPETIRRTGAIALVDGHNQLGHVVAEHATDLAIELAGEHGIGIVSVRDSNHFGMAGHWPLKLLRRGLVGFATTNGPPVMTPWGGRAGAICNNPFSWGIPAAEELPILLDMALTAGARGRVRLAAQQGEEIPAGWALDPDGAPTTDAAAALAGVMLPMGAHKGSGIAVVNEVLSSALSGAQYLTQITSTTMASAGVHVSWRVGHIFLALDPAAFRPADEFRAHVDAIIRGLKATPPAVGHEVLMPGERGFLHAAEAERLGVPLAPGSLAKLGGAGAEAGIAFPEPLAPAGGGRAG